MNYSHGSLENEIMKAVWTVEEIESVDVSVNDIQDILNRTSSSTRAYTTVKTVMDRLVEKNILVRYKQGKKFFYKSVSSRDEMAEQAIKRLADQYFNNDMDSFANTVRAMSTMHKQSRKVELV